MSEQLRDKEAIRRRRNQIRRMEEKRRRRKKRMIQRFCVKVTVYAVCILIVIGVISVGKNLITSFAKKENDNNTVENLANAKSGQGEQQIEQQEKEEQDIVPNAETSENGNEETAQNIEEQNKETIQQEEESLTNETAASEVSTVLEGSYAMYASQVTADTITLEEEIVSSNAVFIDLDTGSILAEKGAMTRINPASMTKVLTILVAAEHVENLDDTFTITLEETDYSYINECSNAGFGRDETVTVRDLFYGTILPSGGEAAAGLAAYVSGSRDAFVELMNEKLVELGLSDTAHVTNCVGLYDENHYCTVYDMAVIMQAALENEFCREVLSAHTYTTSKTEQHPDGIVLSNWFLRRIEDRDTGGVVLCGKTGYVEQSGNCAVSYGTDNAGKEYICVTVNAGSGWLCIADHTTLYKKFSTGGMEESNTEENSTVEDGNVEDNSSTEENSNAEESSTVEENNNIEDNTGTEENGNTEENSNV